MKIAILGFGNVGRQLVKLFSQAGYDVIVGLRSTSNEPATYYSTTFEEAASLANVIVLAIPFLACADVLPAIAHSIDSKIVIDLTNPINPDWSPLLLGEENSAAEEISRLLPKANVVKAFNTIFADAMDSPMRRELAIAAFVAGDSHDAKQTVMTAIAKIGYNPIDAGPLWIARYLESMAHLNIQLAIGQEQGTDAAFAYV